MVVLHVVNEVAAGVMNAVVVDEATAALVNAVDAMNAVDVVNMVNSVTWKPLLWPAPARGR